MNGYLFQVDGSKVGQYVPLNIFTIFYITFENKSVDQQKYVWCHFRPCSVSYLAEVAVISICRRNYSCVRDGYILKTSCNGVKHKMYYAMYQ